MSLVGNLEDLGLGDILQIVSLSRKSGVLSLRNRGREGRIVFLHGQVIQATSSVFRETLGDLLLRKGLVDLDTLKKALALQRQMSPPVRLGTILSERFNVARGIVEGILREQVEKIVYSFFGWTEGTFSFDLGEPDDLAATRFDPLQFMLDQGLNLQWLALGGERGRPDFSRTPAETAPPPSGDGTELPWGHLAEGEGDRSTHFNLGAELFEELGEEPQMGIPAAASPGLHLLKGMLQELGSPSLGGGIILLVLRFAAEFMNRAVVFSVKGREIVGLGQFGIEFPDAQADARVRAMRFPVEEESPFSPVLEEKVPLKVPPGRGAWDVYLQEMLGMGAPEEIFLGPIVSEGKIVAVLYGDNLPRRDPVGDTEPLEIFLSQAGMAMEKALLERRLQGVNAIQSGER